MSKTYYAADTFTSVQTYGLIHQNQEIELEPAVAKELLAEGLLVEGKAPEPPKIFTDLKAAGIKPKNGR